MKQTLAIYPPVWFTDIVVLRQSVDDEHVPETPDAARLSIADDSQVFMLATRAAPAECKLEGFSRDQTLWLAHLRFAGSLAYPPFPAFARKARKVGLTSWSDFVRGYGL